MHDGVCGRCVTERPGVVLTPGEAPGPGVLPARYRAAGRATERPGVLPPVCYRTTGCATGVLPNDRVLAVCYRTTVRVAERLGVLPRDQVCYRCVAMWDLLWVMCDA